MVLGRIGHGDLPPEHGKQEDLGLKKDLGLKENPRLEENLGK